MTEQDTTTTTTQTEQKNGCCYNRHNSGQHCHGKHRFARFIGMLAILGIGFMAGKCFAFEHGWCHDGAPDFISGKPIDPQQMSKMAEKRIEHLLSEVDASKDQKTKAAEIVNKSVLNGAPLAEQMRANHKKMMTLLSSKELDKEAVEQLRIDQLKNADEISKQMTQTMLAIAEVLTPEQRAKLSEKMVKHGGWMHN
jgi:Spy/CpxP family protein refolding chaperone